MLLKHIQLAFMTRVLKCINTITSFPEEVKSILRACWTGPYSNYVPQVVKRRFTAATRPVAELLLFDRCQHACGGWWNVRVTLLLEQHPEVQGEADVLTCAGERYYLADQDENLIESNLSHRFGVDGQPVPIHLRLYRRSDGASG